MRSRGDSDSCHLSRTQTVPPRTRGRKRLREIYLWRTKYSPPGTLRGGTQRFIVFCLAQCGRWSRRRFTAVTAEEHQPARAADLANLSGDRLSAEYSFDICKWCVNVDIYIYIYMCIYFVLRWLFTATDLCLCNCIIISSL